MRRSTTLWTNHFWWWWRRKMALMRAWRSGTQWLHYSRQKLGQDHFPQMERENLGTAWHKNMRTRDLREGERNHNLISKYFVRKEIEIKSFNHDLCLTLTEVLSRRQLHLFWAILQLMFKSSSKTRDLAPVWILYYLRKISSQLVKIDFFSIFLPFHFC